MVMGVGDKIRDAKSTLKIKTLTPKSKMKLNISLSKRAIMVLLPAVVLISVGFVMKCGDGRQKLPFSNCFEAFPDGQPPDLGKLTKEEAAARSALKLRDLCYQNYAVLYSTTNKRSFITIERLRYKSPTVTISDDGTSVVVATKIGVGPSATPDPEPVFVPIDFRWMEEKHRLLPKDRMALSDVGRFGSDYVLRQNIPLLDVPALPPRDKNPEHIKVLKMLMRDTFNLASTTPMHATLASTNTNGNGVWTSIEDTIREYSKKSKGPEDIYVYTGSSGGTDTKAPTHVWKLVYDSSAKKAWAYWLPNTASSAMYNPEAAATTTTTTTTATTTATTTIVTLTLEQLRENIKAIDGVDILFNVKLPSAPAIDPETEEDKE